MSPVILTLDERLANPGDSLPVSGHIDDKSYTQGEREFQLPQGLDYDVVLTNAGEGILATGILKGHVVGTCDRCLDPAEFDVSGEVDEYFLFHEPEEARQDNEEEGPDYALVGPDDTVDLTEALLTALAEEIPFVVLCKPDCKGLCPVCGANLNHEDCGHAAQIQQERLERSPFAVLKNLKLDDDSDDAKGSK
ncbi:MAG: YceD family protein [Atopobiaceae bacterium]